MGAFGIQFISGLCAMFGQWSECKTDAIVIRTAVAFVIAVGKRKKRVFVNRKIVELGRYWESRPSEVWSESFFDIESRVTLITPDLKKTIGLHDLYQRYHSIYVTRKCI